MKIDNNKTFKKISGYLTRIDLERINEVDNNDIEFLHKFFQNQEKEFEKLFRKIYKFKGKSFNPIKTKGDRMHFLATIAAKKSAMSHMNIGKKSLWKRMKEEFYNHPLTIILTIIAILVGIIIALINWKFFATTVLSIFVGV